MVWTLTHAGVRRPPGGPCPAPRGPARPRLLTRSRDGCKNNTNKGKRRRNQPGTAPIPATATQNHRGPPRTTKVRHERRRPTDDPRTTPASPGHHPEHHPCTTQARPGHEPGTINDRAVMYAEERQTAILHRAPTGGRVDVVALAEELAVPTEPIRRDLTVLERAG